MILDLKALQALCDAATSGPWSLREHPRGPEYGCFVTAPDVNGFAYAAEILGDDEYREQSGGMARRTADAAFIAACREAVPALIQEVAALRPLVEMTRRYATHRYDCTRGMGQWTAPVWRGDQPCSCGFDAALSALALPEAK